MWLQSGSLFLFATWHLHLRKHDVRRNANRFSVEGLLALHSVRFHLHSSAISIAEGTVNPSSAARLAEWQSGDVWFSKQERSHAETESDVETIRTDNIVGNSFAIFCIE